MTRFVGHRIVARAAKSGERERGNGNYSRIASQEHVGALIADVLRRTCYTVYRTTPLPTPCFEAGWL